MTLTTRLGSFALTLVVVFVFGRPLIAQAKMEYVARIVTVRPLSPPSVFVQESPWEPAREGQSLRAGAVVRTGARGRAVVLLADQTTLYINSGSEVELVFSHSRDSLVTRLINVAGSVVGSSDSLLRLVAGELFISKKVPTEVTVKTISVSLRTRGTEFLVRADAEQSVVTVLEGSVEARNSLGSVEVAAGQRSLTNRNGRPGRPIRVESGDSAQWTFFYSASLSPFDYPFRSPPRDQAAPRGDAERRSGLKAQSLFDAGDPEAALQALQGAVGPEASEVRGWIYLAQNRFGEALAEFERAPPGSPRVRLGQSMAHFQLGEFEAAYRLVSDDPTGILLIQKALLDLYFSDVASARTTLEGISATDPNYALSQGLLSTVLLVQDHPEEARNAALAASQADPRSPTAWLALSRVQQSRFQLDEARHSVKTALDLDPGFVDARVQYAALLFGEGRNDEAEYEVRRVVERDPRSAPGHSLLGFVLLAKGETSEARAAFQKATDLDSGLGDPRLGLGLVDLRQNRLAAAAVRMLEAAAINPRLSIYQSYLAKALYEEGFFEQALTALERAKELDPLDPTPHLYAGIFQNDLNRPGLAVEEFRESIRLNDNRAVYRSRFLLDQDRATRNVRLATAYVRLGLSDQAELEAIQSNLSDLTVSSAHFFLADAYLNLPGRTVAAGSESLLGRLLQPVNANSFNSFNDYTTLLERPRFDWTAEGGYGSFGSPRASLIQTGGTTRYAYGSATFFDRTNGFLPQNGDATNYTSTNFFKLVPASGSELLLSYSFDQNRGGSGGAIFAGQLADPDARSLSRIHRAELGYHWRHRKGSEFVFLVSGRGVSQVIEGGKVETVFGPAESRFSSRTPNVSVQAAHLLKISNLQIRYGVDLFKGRITQQETLRFPEPGGVTRLDPSETLHRDVSFTEFFLQGDLAVHPKWIVTGGLSYHKADLPLAARDRLEFRDNQYRTSRWSPRLGALYRPSPTTALRFAYSRILRTHGQETLAPAHLEGFPLLQNEPELASSANYQFGWDLSWGGRTFLRATAFRRDRETPAALFPAGVLSVVAVQGDSHGGRLVLNQFLTDRLTLSSQYSFTSREDRTPVGDEFVRGSFRRDHEARLALFYIHPRGLFLELSQSFLRQRGRIGGALSGRRVLGGLETGPTLVSNSDVSIAYEFPRKIGLFSFSVRNLFDDRDDFLIDPLSLETRLPRRSFEFRLSFNF